MSTKAAHTPTPWKYSESFRGNFGQQEKDMTTFYCIMQDVDGNGPDASIANVEHGSHTFKFGVDYRHEITLDTAKANAEFIITAVNHHQELITRLYNLVNAIETETDEDTTYSDINSMVMLRIKEARETLKKVIQ